MKNLVYTQIFLFVILSCTNNVKKSKLQNFKIVSKSKIIRNNYDKIGFKCGEGGQKTKLVDDYTNKIKNKDFEQIKLGLYSSQPGIVYLSTITCNKLGELGILKLNKKELLQIKKNGFKNDTINTCSGCTNFENYTIKQLINDTNNYMAEEAMWWFDEILINNIIEK